MTYIDVYDKIKINITGALGAGHHLGTPSCVIPLNGKHYYLERTGAYENRLHGLGYATTPGLWKYDPDEKGLQDFIRSPRVEIGKNYTSALGVNHDGSLIVARMDGIHYFDPNTKEYTKVCDIPGVSDLPKYTLPTICPNNGVMIKCHDDKTRFFLGTCNLVGDVEQNSLWVLENNNGTFSLEKVKGTDNLISANGITGYSEGGKTHITYSDTNAGKAVLYSAEYMPTSKSLSNIATLVDFKNGGNRALGGCPSAASPLTYNGQRCVAVAVDGTNKIRIYPATGENLDVFKMIAEIALPVKARPTMPTFYKEGNTTVAYIPTTARDEDDRDGGYIYKANMPEGFEPVNHVGTYPKLEEVKAAQRFANQKSGGSGGRGTVA